MYSFIVQSIHLNNPCVSRLHLFLLGPGTISLCSLLSNMPKKEKQPFFTSHVGKNQVFHLLLCFSFQCVSFTTHREHSQHL